MTDRAMFLVLKRFALRSLSCGPSSPSLPDYGRRERNRLAYKTYIFYRQSPPIEEDHFPTKGAMRLSVSLAQPRSAGTNMGQVLRFRGCPRSGGAYLSRRYFLYGLSVKFSDKIFTPHRRQECKVFRPVVETFYNKCR